MNSNKGQRDHLGSQLKTGVISTPPPPITGLQAREKELPTQNKETVSAAPSTPHTFLLPLSCMPLCQRIEARGSADSPGFYPIGHKKQLTAPCSNAATKIAGAKYGSGQVKTPHSANPNPDSLLPNCLNR